MTYKNEIQRMFDLQKFGMKFGLDNILNILAKLGNPHLGQKFVHLAGTNGKGSVGLLLKNILTESGYRVGFYTSPHLITFRERIAIADELISEDDILRLSARIWSSLDPDSPPTFFEFVTALAFLYFKEQKTDLAIIEAGLGGRLDSTNVIEPLISAIINVTLEHTEHLGETITKIAVEKAGIIKPGIPVVCGKLLNEAKNVIEKTASTQNSPILILDRDFMTEITNRDDSGHPTINYRKGDQSLTNLAIGLAGSHQADNAAVALTLLSLLLENGFAASEENIRAGLKKSYWPGRAEIFPAGSWPPIGPKARVPLLLDGAHNPAGAEALARMLKERPYHRLHLIAGVMADKNIPGVLGPILQKVDRLYLTRPKFNRAATPENLLEKITASFGPPKIPVTLHPKLKDVFTVVAAEVKTGDLAILSGSLFMVGESLAYLKNLGDVESN